MNPEPFIIAAYVVAVGAILGLVLLSHAAMRRAEKSAARMGRRR